MGYSTTTSAAYGVELSVDEARRAQALLLTQYDPDDLADPNVGEPGMWGDGADMRCQDLMFDPELDTHVVGIMLVHTLSWKDAAQSLASLSVVTPAMQARFEAELAPLLAQAGVTRTPAVVTFSQTG